LGKSEILTPHPLEGTYGVRYVTLDEFKAAMQREFEMRDLGLMNTFWELKLRNLLKAFSYVNKSML
jgi:hypothetical protein